MFNLQNFNKGIQKVKTQELETKKPLQINAEALYQERDLNPHVLTDTRF